MKSAYISLAIFVVSACMFVSLNISNLNNEFGTGNFETVLEYIRVYSIVPTAVFGIATILFALNGKFNRKAE